MTLEELDSYLRSVRQVFIQDRDAAMRDHGIREEDFRFRGCIIKWEDNNHILVACETNPAARPKGYAREYHGPIRFCELAAELENHVRHGTTRWGVDDTVFGKIRQNEA